MQLEPHVPADNKNLKTLPIPFKKEQLDLYKSGESVYYETMGGYMFLGGAAVAGAFTGGSVLAEGGFKTLVTKLNNEKVAVEVTKSSLKKASLFTGIAVLKLDATKDNLMDSGFSYIFDLRSKDATNAYEQLLAGNAIPAQELSENGIISGVTKVSSFNKVQAQNKRTLSFGIPMVFIHNWTTGKTYGQTETITHEDQSKTDLNYGVYFKEHNGRFFHKHKKLLRSFYSGKAVYKAQNGIVKAQDQRATYLWSYENDSKLTPYIGVSAFLSRISL